MFSTFLHVSWVSNVQKIFLFLRICWGTCRRAPCVYSDAAVDLFSNRRQGRFSSFFAFVLLCNCHIVFTCFISLWFLRVLVGFLLQFDCCHNIANIWQSLSRLVSSKSYCLKLFIFSAHFPINEAVFIYILGTHFKPNTMQICTVWHVYFQIFSSSIPRPSSRERVTLFASTLARDLRSTRPPPILDTNRRPFSQ
jgi:hypothetical protein